MFGASAERWSLSLGGFQGVPLRAHLSLLVLMAVVVATTAFTQPIGGAILLAVLVASAALHEAAHLAAAWRLRQDDHTVVLSPIGGLRLPACPADPEAQLLVAMVGPLVNLTVVVLSAGALAYTSENLVNAFSLSVPAGLLSGAPLEVALKGALWVNWLIFLASLIPAYPFDAGPALRAMLWPMLGRRSAEVFTAQLGRVVGLSLVVAAVVVLQSSPGTAAASSAALASLGLLVVCSAQHDLAAATRTPGVTLAGFLESSPLPVGAKHAPQDRGGRALEAPSDDQWLPQALLPNLSETAIDDALDDSLPDAHTEDEAVDAILARLHRNGPNDLSDEDRRILHRASERYRQRRG